ncbi:PAC2 family protein [Bifidobacterium simiiventris]|uniref:PAC2 family protein n=1 Tax=Bifidobacterium simiiventris TaxID=2834434 RepID=UPI001C585C4B|nr:PAC2 family protein [Bifidobacterium simiiventris]MBW3079326.1 PAC2 family protein [Bifidobacterium simiiventris]
MKRQAAETGSVMIAAFEGWNDACQAASDAVRHLVKRYDGEEIRHIRCDGYYDYQSTRPIVCHATGRKRIIWPQTTFYDIRISPAFQLYAMLAPEPNYRWQEHCRQTLRIADELDVTRIITLGSMFADCPHTRTLPVDIEYGSDCTECDPDQRYSGPVGIPTILDDAASQDGFDTTSMWVSIPQYLNSDGCAQATMQLLHELSGLLGESIDLADLPGKAQDWKARAEAVVRRNDALSDYVRRLEHDYDSNEKARQETTLDGPVCEQLIREAENFLRDL